MMASQPEPDVVALVRALLERGQAFSITLEHPESPAVKSAKSHGHDFNLNFAPGDGDCIAWIQVPGKGLVCVKHKGD
jgi:hypothetical protein